MFAQKPRHKSIDQWVVKKVEEFFALVDQCPYSLVGTAAVLFAHTGLILAGCLLLDSLFQDGILLGCQGVLEEAVSGLDNIALDLLDIVGGLR